MRTRWLLWISGGKADLPAFGRLQRVRRSFSGGGKVRFYGTCVAVVIAASTFTGAQQIDVQTRGLLENGIDAFLAGRVEESVVLFDRVAKQAPGLAPELWQRGIALYYVGRYRDCRAQFESHRTVNPNDVENPAWHFLCVARAETPARALTALLPVGPDQRSPMREVYQMFQGTLPPERVLAAAGDSLSAQFYAELYVGLYYEATGDPTRALEHLKLAASDRFRIGGYMHTVARLHPMVRLKPDTTKK
jgi:lipoprotein NlpI